MALQSLKTAGRKTKPPGVSAAGAQAPAKTAVARQQRHHTLLNFRSIASMQPLERIDMIRQGVVPSEFKTMVKQMDTAQDRVVKYLDLSVATVNRKSKLNETLSPSESDRVIGLASLIGQIQTMVERSGDPTDFDAAKWVSEWLEQPLPALAGKKPADYMDTATGQAMIANLLATMESGAYT